MPKTLRLVVASAFFLCVFSMAGTQLAVASQSSSHKVPAYKREYLANYAELVHRHGVHAAGCNLVTDKYKNRCRGKVTKPDVVKSNATIERMLYVPPPQPVAAASAVQPGSLSTATSPSSSGGTYCGLFQFDQGTWESVGGSGSPCAASSAEQWSRARLLQQQRGNQPWPKCGANGASLEAIMQCESGGNPSIAG